MPQTYSDAITTKVKHVVNAIEDLRRHIATMPEKARNSRAAFGNRGKEIVRDLRDLHTSNELGAFRVEEANAPAGFGIPICPTSDVSLTLLVRAAQAAASEAMVEAGKYR